MEMRSFTPSTIAKSSLSADDKQDDLIRDECQETGDPNRVTMQPDSDFSAQVASV
jgi:hypothetical protein